MNRRTIPQLRTRLLEIADGLDEVPGEGGTAAELRQIVTELVRRSPTRKRAPVQHRPLTDSERIAIRQYARDNPDVHMSEIATMFRTNPGRVSEAVRGHDG